MTHDAQRFSDLFEKLIVWGLSFMLILISLIYGYGLLEGEDAVASENEQSAANSPSSESTVSIDSILSDSDALCIVAMNTSKKVSIKLTENASIKTNGCNLHSNVKDHSAKAIHIARYATLDTAFAYSNGGISDKSEGFSLERLVNSREIEDPLLGGVRAPEFEGCDYRNIALKPGKNSLMPGVYCGGIIALADSKIELEPGVYVMKNGPLVLGGKASLIGEEVGFYFTGSNAVINLGVSTKLSLTAPIGGPMSGVIFFEDRNAAKNNEFIIRSGNAKLLEGVIYLPKAKFIADAAAQIGQDAKWTALIANKIEVRNSAKLVMNSDYSGSAVPVPEGVWPNAPVAVLSN